jgi:hypothetical protein
MQYLVEAARGPLPPSPEQAIALLEGTVIPHFEYMIRLKAEGKMRVACRSAIAPSRASSRPPRTTKSPSAVTATLATTSSHGKDARLTRTGADC